jgi:hypothetical protein
MIFPCTILSPWKVCRREPNEGRSKRVSDFPPLSTWVIRESSLNKVYTDGSPDREANENSIVLVKLSVSSLNFPCCTMPR